MRLNFLLASSLIAAAPCWAGATPSQVRTAPPASAVRVTLVNMSGKSRTALIRGEHIPLPVGRQVILRVAPGQQINVLSENDERVAARILVSAADDRLVLPVR